MSTISQMSAQSMKSMLQKLVQRAVEAQKVLKEVEKKEIREEQREVRIAQSDLLSALQKGNVEHVQDMLECDQQIPSWLIRKARTWLTERLYEQTETRHVSTRLRRMLNQTASEVLVSPRVRRTMEVDLRCAEQLPKFDSTLLSHAKEFLEYLDEAENVKKKVYLHAAKSIGSKDAYENQLPLPKRLQRKMDTANKHIKRINDACIAEATNLENAMDSGDRVLLGRALRSARAFTQKNKIEGEMLDLMADASDLLEDLNEEESRGRLAVAKYRQAQRVGASDRATIWKDVALEAGVNPEKLQAQCAERISEKNLKRQEKQQAIWPQIIERLEINFDDEKQLAESIKEARLAHLPEEAILPFESRLKDLVESTLRHSQLLAELSRIEILLTPKEDNPYIQPNINKQQIAKQISNLIENLENSPPEAKNKLQAIIIANQLLKRCQIDNEEWTAHQREPKPYKSVSESIETVDFESCKEQAEQNLIMAWRHGTIQELKTCIKEAKRFGVEPEMVKYVCQQVEKIEIEEQKKHPKKQPYTPRFPPTPKSSTPLKQTPRRERTPTPKKHANKPTSSFAPPTKITPRNVAKVEAKISDQHQQMVANAARLLDRALRMQDVQELQRAIGYSQHLLRRI